MVTLIKNKYLILSWFFVRVIAAVIVTPVLAERLFLPHFLDQTNPFDFDTQGQNSEMGESPFPYGIPMYLVYLPVYAAVKFSNSANFNLLAGISVFAITIVGDYLIFRILRKRATEPRVLLLWSLSPIVLWSAYFSGESDLWPALLFLVSCRYLVDKESPKKAGMFLGFAIGCKYGLILVIPFALVYLLDNPRYKKQFKEYLATSLITAAVCYFPALYSEGFRDLVFKSEFSKQILEVGIDFGTFEFYIVPALYIVLLVWIYRAGRTTPQVFIIFLSVAVVATVLFTPAAFGWILWVLPTLLIYLDVKKSELIWVFAVFQIVYLASKSSLAKNLGFEEIEWFYSVSQTILTVYSLFFLMRILQHGVLQGDVYSLAKEPFSVSISGDSGVGKDSLTFTLQEAFGAETTTVICGDNYHLFERGDYVWGSKTHLNPQMNDISQWKNDLLSAKSRDTFISREYDHTKGRFKTAKSSKRADLVVSQGLHANYGELHGNSNTSIHLEMDEELRIHLKLLRDVKARNHSRDDVVRQLEGRKDDFNRFINVQRESCDLVIRFLPGDALEVRYIEVSSSKKSKLIADIYQEILIHCPQALMHTDERESLLRIDCSQISGAFTGAALQDLMIGFHQFFPTPPKFKGQLQGMLQFIVFRAIEFNRQKKG
jgi:uridine kinase